MSVQSLPMPIDPVTQAFLSAPMLEALLNCSDELREHAGQMIVAMRDKTLDDQERQLAAHTLFEILVPYFNEDDGMPGMDLEHANKLCKSHDLDPADPRSRELGESAEVLAIHAAENATFSTRLEAAMGRADLSQTALAERIGVSQAAISLMLKRECRPQRRTVRKLASALGVSPQDLWPEFGEE